MLVALPSGYLVLERGGDELLLSFAVVSSLAGSCGAYVAWRTLGSERAPDLLVGDEVQEIDGIALRVPRSVSAAPGGTTWVGFEVQNAWTVAIEFNVWLRPRNKGISEMPRHVVQPLGPLEVGTLWIPMTTDAAARGRLRVAYSVAGRGRSWRGRRGRLRPKAPFPVGPLWLLTVMALAADDWLEYRNAGFELALGDSERTDAVRGATTRWESTWVPGASA